MISGRQDDAQVRTLPAKADKVACELQPYVGRRLLDIEDIPRHQKRIGTVSLTPIQQLAEEAVMFIGAVVVLIDDLPEVQVGSVDDFHFVMFCQFIL